MRWLALLLVAGLGACSRADFGAPVVHGDRAKASPPRSAPTASLTGGEVVVRPGDSVSKIAKEHGVDLRALVDANRLRSPYRIYPGQRLALPRSGPVHVVRAGETVTGVANRYGVASQQIVRQNNLPPPYRVAPGQEITVPVTKTIAISPAEAALAASAAGKVESLPTGPLPAGRVQMAALAPLSAAGSIAAATNGKSAVDAGAPQSSARPAPFEAAISENRLTPEQIALAVGSKRTPVDIGAPPPRTGRRFLWPVKGDVIVGFGPRAGGLQNDGINIRAGRGATVKAAESGIVAYAGNELRGFGNLLLVKHADGWMSAYAHNDTLLVKTGDRVRRGQSISRVGSTGSVGQPQLHFELRRGSRAVDPIQYLAGGEV